MIIEENNILNFVKLHSKVVSKEISLSRAYHKRLKALVYGDKFKELLLQIEHIEVQKKAEARKKYSRSIKDVYSKILEPVNNVYSANGGSKIYNINNDTAKKELLKSLNDIRGGLTLEQWLHRYWSKDLYVIDPAGVMMYEYTDDENVYLTYKSIDCIRYYKLNGLKVEYILFEPEDIDGTGKKKWRFIDDAKDYTIIQDGDTFTINEEESYDNAFGSCPARVNSDRIDIISKMRLSPVDVVIETSEELLRDRSILTIYKFLNGFAVPFRPKIICPECRGLGKTGVDICKKCDGKGIILDKDVTDEIILPVTLDSEDSPNLPTNFAGFISPPLDIWNQYKVEEDRFIDSMFETLWGTRETEVKDQTAMGAYLNLQPMIAKLSPWSDVAESHEQGFTDLLAIFKGAETNGNEPLSQISYGRNYIIQPPNYLLDQYQKSLESNSPVVVLDTQLNEYIASKYKNNPVSLRKQLIKKELEPYIFLNIETVEKIYGNTEAQKKGLYAEWWMSLNMLDFRKPIEDLKKNRDEYFNKNIINKESDGNSNSETV